MLNSRCVHLGTVSRLYFGIVVTTNKQTDLESAEQRDADLSSPEVVGRLVLPQHGDDCCEERADGTHNQSEYRVPSVDGIQPCNAWPTIIVSQL